MKHDVAEMDPLRIYIDTSVLGGCFDVEFAEWSNGLIGAVNVESGTFP